MPDVDDMRALFIGGDGTRSAPTRSGGYRPDVPFRRGKDGLRVSFRREPGVTPAGYLLVPFRFQAPPLDRYGRRWEMSFPTYDAVTVGERPQDGTPRLQRPSFSTLLTDERYNWQVWRGNYNVQRMLVEMRKIQQKGVPFRLTVSQPNVWGHQPLTDLVVVMVALGTEQRGGEVGIEYPDVECMEWPDDRIRAKRRRRSDRDEDRRHTLVKGDTLYKLALHYYGRKRQWELIAAANGIKRVEPGSAEQLKKWAAAHDRRSLKIPAGAAEQEHAASQDEAEQRHANALEEARER